MKIDIYEIELFNLVIALIPIAVVIVILALWSLNSKTAIYASARMLIQLIAIGYILTSISLRCRYINLISSGITQIFHKD